MQLAASSRNRGLAAGLLALALVALALAISKNPIAQSIGTSPGATSALPAVEPADEGEVEAFMRRGIGREQATRSLELEGEIAEAHLVGKLETALGSTYGGEWFSPATAQLHIAVTSAAGRGAASATVREAGLAPHVSEVRVRSGWAQLNTVQRQWNRRLADLFTRNQITTSLDPRHNSLEVRTASTVPDAKLAELRRHARAATVNVSIVPVANPRLRLERQARCAAFAAGKAFCNPTIVSGVSINPIGQPECTAGPTALPAEGKSTETYLLTAGHCIKEWGGEGVSVWAFEREGLKQKLIGKAVAYKDSNADVGAILVNNPGFWVQEGKIPVVPAIAPWGAAEPEPFAVPGQMASGVGNGACMSGQTTGESCGTISAVNVTAGGVEKLVEVEGATAAEGDSGAPWWSTQKESLHWALGTHVGRVAGVPVYEPLSFSFGQLMPKIDLKLLSQENEKR